LIFSNEEKFLYNNICKFDRLETKTFDIKKLFNLINERSICYSTEELKKLIQYLYLNHKDEFLFLKGKEISSYSNIEKTLRNKNDSTYSDNYYSEVEKIFVFINNN
jgi:hypothetical protein